MSVLTSTADVQLLYGIAVAAAFFLLILVFPVLSRRPYLLVVSLLGAAAFHGRAFAGFVIVNAIAYLVMRGLNRESSRSTRWSFACLAMLSLIVIFTLGRIFQWDRILALPGPAPVLLYTLDMWLVLRLITLFWEVGSGVTAAPSLSDFAIWTSLPLTLMGPLVRYSEFPNGIFVNRSICKSAGWVRDLAAGAAKVLIGQGLFLAQQLLSNALPHAHLLNNAIGTFVTHPLGFYLSIAGYFHIMQALGQPIGFKIPMSFNFPIGRENISAFWMNWNMTATFVFRDYLFYNRWGFRTYNIYFNTIVLFTLVGLWHAANPYWILWGFLHGLLFCTFLLWRKFGSRIEHIPFRGTTTSRTAARILTYVSVCLCWYLPSKILQKLSGI